MSWLYAWTNFLAIALFGFSPSPELSAWVNGWQPNSRVCFFSFDIDTVLPFTEESIQANRLCKYSVDTWAFFGMLTDTDSGSSYNSGHIKAMVDITPAIKLFADSCGRVRAGTRYYRLDKDKFVEALNGFENKLSERGYPPYPLPYSCWNEWPQ